MSTPNTASLERSLQDCSLNHRQQQQSTATTTTGGGEADSPELDSQANSLPFNREQCLDLKTGELYCINSRSGMKTKEDPRTSSDRDNRYSDEYDSSPYNNEEGSSSESSSREQWSGDRNNNNNIDVLVVAGCRSCLMYYMVPKQLQICSKCRGQLLHFDRPQHASS